MELAQGLGLGLQGANKAVFDSICKRYYEQLVECGPTDLATQYTFDMLYEDVLNGMLLWYAAYTFINCQTWPNLKQDPDGGEGRLAGLRLVFPRYISLTDELGLFDHAQRLLDSCD